MRLRYCLGLRWNCKKPSFWGHQRWGSLAHDQRILSSDNARAYNVVRTVLGRCMEATNQNDVRAAMHLALLTPAIAVLVLS